MSGPVFLRGERITLRPVEREDLDFVGRWRNDPRIRRALGEAQPRNRRVLTDAFEDESGDDDVRLLVCVDEEPVGYAALRRIDPIHGNADVTGWTVPDRRERGYGSDALRTLVTYAFEERRLQKLRVRVRADDEAASRTLESVGFRKEGHFRAEWFVGGERRDVHAYGLTADDR